MILISSCGTLSGSRISTFCAEIFANNTLYHYQDGLKDSSYLSSISSLNTESPFMCSNLIKHYLCYHYHPVCSIDTGDVIPLCTNNCELLNRDLCSGLIRNVTKEMELIGMTFPNIECLTTETNSHLDALQTTTPCFDIVKGKEIKSPLYSKLLLVCLA